MDLRRAGQTIVDRSTRLVAVPQYLLVFPSPSEPDGIDREFLSRVADYDACQNGDRSREPHLSF